nr:immunoglobulin light chain junction region [Macaca mulatta]
DYYCQVWDSSSGLF